MAASRHAVNDLPAACRPDVGQFRSTAFSVTNPTAEMIRLPNSAETNPSTESPSVSQAVLPGGWGFSCRIGAGFCHPGPVSFRRDE